MSERPIRVLQVVGTMNPGGIETWLLNVLRFIDRSRFQLDFCTFGPETGLYAPQVEELGGRMIACPIGRNLWSFRNRFRQILRQGNYDVVHSHVMFFSGAVLRWANMARVPVRIAHSHTSQDEKKGRPGRSVYKRMTRSFISRHATHGLAASNLAAGELFGADWENDTRFRVLHCGIDLSRFEKALVPENIRHEFGIPAKAPVVGHVGRFVSAKNHHFFLDVAAEISVRRPEVHFLLVGDGPLREEIEARAKTMGCNGNIHFAGNRTDVPRLLNGAMDVFILPSLWEGIPLALLEAQAAGLACVVSSEITDEADVLPYRCVRISVSDPPSKWAQETLVALSRGRTHDRASLLSIAQTDFCIEQSSSHLSKLYMAVAE